MKLQIVMVEHPFRGRGLYRFEFRIDGKKFGVAACLPTGPLRVVDQMGLILEDHLREAGLDVEDFEEIEEELPIEA
jgi:hypothetical protein